MSGFLTRLAARALGSSRAVEPRLRGRFEPVRRDDFDAGVVLEQFEEGESARPRPPAHELVAQAGERREVRHSPAVRETPAALEIARAVEAESAPRVHEEAPPGPPTIARSRLLAPSPPITASAIDESTPPAEHRPASARQAPDVAPDAIPDPRLRVQEPAASPIADAEVVDEPVFATSVRLLEPDAEAEVVASRHGERVAPLPHAATAGSRSVETSRRSAVQAINDSQSADIDATSEITPDSEPVVYIRIGRIDVKAVMPAPPKQVSRSQQPIESLDDYVRRTSGRR